MAKQNKKLADLYHFDLYGKRQDKYIFLSANSLESIKWKGINSQQPNFYFYQQDFKLKKTYDSGIGINILFSLVNRGTSFRKEDLLLKPHFKKSSAINMVKDVQELDDQSVLDKYKFKETKDWKLIDKRRFFTLESDEDIRLVNYRPFDYRFTFYPFKTINQIIVRGDDKRALMHHIIQKDNIGLITPRQAIEGVSVWVTNCITENKVLSAYNPNYIFPLYTYNLENVQQTIEQESKRKPNLNMEIVQRIADKLGLRFVAEKNSPPLEGYPQGGVVSLPVEEYPQGTVAPTILINNTPIKRNFIKNLPYNPKLKQLAKDKRKAGILSEVLFWKQVHKKNFHEIDFDRQRIIGNYIVDFYVKTLGLVVEIDGSSHDNKAEYDAIRQEYLENLGLKVYRISDSDVKKNIIQVMVDLENYILNEYGETTPSFGHPSTGEETTPSFGHPSEGGELTPIDILDYIYAVLHSPTYREKYKEFLKIDFPRVPYPKNKETFWKLVKLGGEIRQIHLLESPKVEEFITSYPIDGDNTITTKIGKKDWEIIDSKGFAQSEVPTKKGRIWINKTQYFENIPLIAWEFYIGGYQPAQKWLKDRKGRTLSFEDILHYQKIIVALFETDRLMKEIDKIEIE